MITSNYLYYGTWKDEIAFTKFIWKFLISSQRRFTISWEEQDAIPSYFWYITGHGFFIFFRVRHVDFFLLIFDNTIHSLTLFEKLCTLCTLLWSYDHRWARCQVRWRHLFFLWTLFPVCKEVCLRNSRLVCLNKHLYPWEHFLGADQLRRLPHASQDLVKVVRLVCSFSVEIRMCIGN